MPDPEITPRPRAVLTGAEPQLFVADLTASCAFFAQRLGFEIAFVYGDPPYYGQVCRDLARLNLRHVDASDHDQERRERESLLAAAISVDDIEQLLAEYLSVGVTFHQPLRTEAWGARTFIVKDPDGNLLLFAGRAA